MAVGDRLAARLTVGTDGQVLTADSTQASMLNWSTVPALLTTGYRLKRITKITATGTWPRDSDVVAGWVRGWGGGGGSGGADNDTVGECSISRPGAAGGYCESFLEGLSANESVSIGAAGLGGNTLGSDGTTGGNTTFGAHFTAAGGGGGAGTGSTQGGTSVNTYSPVATGGAATGGNILNLTGGQGTIGVRANGDTGVGGNGGDSPNGGRGGPGRAVENAGIAGDTPGGGGAGVASSATSGRSGGDGGAGLIIVFELMR